jgi:hypothetical protein
MLATSARKIKNRKSLLGKQLLQRISLYEYPRGKLSKSRIVTGQFMKERVVANDAI